MLINDIKNKIQRKMSKQQKSVRFNNKTQTAAVAAAQMPYNFMKEIKSVRLRIAELQDKHTEALWVVVTPQVAQGMYMDLCARVPEVKSLYGAAEVLFNKALTPLENKQMMFQKLGPFITSERMYKALLAFWNSTMAFLMRTNETAKTIGEINKLNQQMVMLDQQNALLRQLLEMHEHIITKSSSCDEVERLTRAIENEHVKDNMYELLETTRPMLQMLYAL
jgi:hypothetical protein